MNAACYKRPATDARANSSTSAGRTPITTTAGLAPIATLAGTATGHLDPTAVNGVRYHYAITARIGSSESVPSGSVGPRTPRNELDLQVATISRLPRSRMGS